MKIRKYTDGRWGFDDYSTGTRRMVRVSDRETAVARLKIIEKPLNPTELKDFERWKTLRGTRNSLCSDGRRKRDGMTTSEWLVWEHVNSWKDTEILKCGWPDFLVRCGGGSLYCIEVKTGSEPVTDRQKKMHEMLRRAGIETFIVRDGWCEELQRRFAPPRKSILNLQTSDRKEGDAPLTNAHATSQSDTPTDAPHLVSDAVPTVQPAGTA